jgi:hypothetical protein
VCKAQNAGSAAGVQQCVGAFEATGKAAQALGQCIVKNCKDACGL